MEIREVIRRWQQGESARSIAQACGLARNTVDKYLRLAPAGVLTARVSEPLLKKLWERLGIYSGMESP